MRGSGHACEHGQDGPTAVDAEHLALAKCHGVISFSFAEAQRERARIGLFELVRLTGADTQAVDG